MNFKSKFGLHCLGRDRAFRRFWVFDSVPGLFVEHDDNEVICLDVFMAMYDHQGG